MVPCRKMKNKGPDSTVNQGVFFGYTFFLTYSFSFYWRGGEVVEFGTAVKKVYG
jgi:hypothetical protein